MDRTPRKLIIDARPVGPRGPFAVERVRGRSVLDRLFDLAESVAERPVPVYARPEDRTSIEFHVAARPEGRFIVCVGPIPDGAAALTTDCLYDPARLRRALRRGTDMNVAVIWRLDRPGALDAAGDELTRRETYQPLGRYWALEPARRIARALAPTRVRPNAVTVAAGTLMLAASAVVAFAQPGRFANLVASAAMALALVLDTADGHLARLQGTASAFGRWLDAWLDELCDMALHAAIAWSAFARTGEPAWLLVGMFYAMGKYVFLVGATEPAGTTEADVHTEAPARSFARDTVRLAGHADVRWHLWVVLALAGRLDLALAAYAVYFPARSLLGAAGKAVRHA